MNKGYMKFIPTRRKVVVQTHCADGYAEITFTTWQALKLIRALLICIVRAYLK
jgi:hypothetical protein